MGIDASGSDCRRRIGGRRLAADGRPPQGLLGLAGKPMIQHVAERLAPQVRGLAISVHGEGEAFRALGLPLIADPSGERQGPLGGMLACMTWARANRPDAPWIVTASCDAPFFPDEYVNALARAAMAPPPGDKRIVIAASDGRDALRLRALAGGACGRSGGVSGRGRTPDAELDRAACLCSGRFPSGYLRWRAIRSVLQRQHA